MRSKRVRLFLATTTALVCIATTAPESIAQYGTAPVYQLTVDASNLIRAGNSQMALTRLQQAYSIAPNSWDVNYFMAFALENLGDLPSAQSWYKRAYAIDPSRHEALLGLGRTFYSQKDFRNALPIMEQMTLSHPATQSTYASYLALAKCYAEVGRYQDFESTMQKALSYRANDPSAWLFAAQEMDALGQMESAVRYYKEYVKRFPQQPDVQTADKRIYALTYQEDKVERLKEVSEGFTLHSDTDDLKDFVQIVDPEKEGVSNTAVSQVLLGLSEIPRTYRHQLEADGFKVVITPDLVDAMPQLAGQKPRGYRGNADWHSSNGATDRAGKRIVVAEKWQTPPTGGPATRPALDKIVQHEFGHAYDLYAGIKKYGQSSTNTFPEISHSQQFIDAYNKDAAAVPESLKGKLAYYLQPGDAGREELFAQMFVLFFGPRPEPGSPRESFQIAFPTVMALMHEARKNDPDFERLQAIYEAKFQDNILTPEQRVQKILQQ